MSSAIPPSSCPAHAQGWTGTEADVPADATVPVGATIIPAGATVYDTPTGLLPLAEAVSSPDPQAVYRRLRAEWGNVAKVELEPGVPAWLVMGYRELLTITRQEQLYSRDNRKWRHMHDGVVAQDSGLLGIMGWRENVIGSDGPEHRRLRKPLDDGVAEIDQRRLRREVEQVCTDLVVRFSERGHADLLTEYAVIVPMLALASLFGIDSAEGMELLEAQMATFGSGDDAQAANRRFEEILLAKVREREKNPTDDMTTVFINHPNLHNEAERLHAIIVMLAAGNGTVTAWIAHTLHLMLTDARFAAQLHGGRLGVDDALDEVLWREPPMNNMPSRYALQDTELGGQFIQAGDCLILGLGAANADPAILPDHGELEPGNRAHLSFSAGPHVCPAQMPARLITRTAVKTALHLLPDVRLSIPAEEVAWRPSPWVRVPVALPAEFSAVRPSAHRGR